VRGWVGNEKCQGLGEDTSLNFKTLHVRKGVTYSRCMLLQFI